MTYFPTEVFKSILEFCDDTIERKQKRLWDSIKVIDSSSAGKEEDRGRICRVIFLDEIRQSLNCIKYPDYEKHGVEGIMRNNFIDYEDRIDGWWYSYKTYEFMYRINKNTFKEIGKGKW